MKALTCLLLTLLALPLAAATAVGPEIVVEPQYLPGSLDIDSVAVGGDRTSLLVAGVEGDFSSLVTVHAVDLTTGRVGPRLTLPPSSTPRVGLAYGPSIANLGA